MHKNKRGKIVTKAQSAAGKKAYKHLAGWTAAVKKAKAELALKKSDMHKNKRGKIVTK